MKLPFTIYDLRFTIRGKPGRAVSPLTADGAHGVTRPTALNRKSSIANHKSQRAVALVMTLILLSVTLVMALAFLAITGRERGSVTTQTDTATTRLAADAGLAAAEAQIAANILSTTNPYNFGLLVSTNYIPQPTGSPLNDLANLFISPRAPVYLTNTVAHVMENRFYLDLNRNGRDDPNRWIPNVDNLGNITFDSSGTNPIESFQVGDPEWIGVLERPDQPYGPNNKFIARFAFIALPVGNSLDLNAIHNQALSQARRQKSLASIPIAPDYYARNQGVGSWEINLAAFLTDLNANEWDLGSNPYNYIQPQTDSAGNLNWGNYANSGRGFEDAFVLLTNRYAGSYNTLPGVTNVFGAPGATAFANDYIDGYTDGPLMTNAQLQVEDDININFLWVGADNTNHFFTPEELFNPSETASFGIHLLDAGTNTFGGTTASTYDRYTLYRMLSQLGTDTTPESGKMNLNYDNLVQANFPSGAVSETNFIPWQPLAFFTNAADRMLRAYTAEWKTAYTNDFNGVLVPGLNTNFVATFNVTNDFGVTDIPVWVSNRFVYTPAVQRVLQLAANIYDATSPNYYPSVFRPLFSTTNTGGYVNVFVTGYTNVPFIGNPTQLAKPIDASTLAATPNLPNNIVTNVYGVPWIIGAKKGFPNFNAFTMENVFQITRKLQLTRSSTNVTYWANPGEYTVSQQLSLVITNLLGVECWNSYRADYTTNPITIYAAVTNTVFLTNDEGLSYPIYSYIPGAIAITNWPGYGSGTVPQPTSFLIPLAQSERVLPDAIYTFNLSTPFVLPAPAYFVTNTLTPHWGLLITNRLQVVMLESNAVDTQFHVIDYVQLLGPDSSHDLSADIQNLYDTKINSGYDDQWNTNINNGIPMGMGNQIGVSAQLVQIRLSPYWSQQDPTSVTNQTALFRGFLGFGPLSGVSPSSVEGQAYTLGQTSFYQQAPYGPTALVAYQTQWQANDPLVHYLASDLTDFNKSTGASINVEPLTFGVLNDRYKPWGGNPQFVGADLNPFNLALKDPLVRSSDDWNFPTNKLPTTGWLGRVHRGTPWQTVYLKSADVLANNNLGAWAYLTGNLNPLDATNTAPVQDRLLFDLFTTAFNDNATRGTLSVNQSADQYDPDGNPADINPAAGLAAWSALFSGIVVATNPVSGYTVINPAGPAGMNSALGTLVANINYTRYNFTNADGLAGVFEHQGDILRAPQLTDQSPFLNGLNATNAISDAMYEWLPQQAMSLLRVGTPRYVIYSYGQALKPAPNGTYLGAPAGMFGMVTNYQVVSEIATRAVVRFETARTNVIGNKITVTPPRAIIESFNILPPD